MRLRRKKKQPKPEPAKAEKPETEEASKPETEGAGAAGETRIVADKQQNGEMKSGSLKNSKTHTPPVERKSKLSAFGRIFKPWKWKRRKKPSEKIEKQAVDLERKISVRTTREELIKRGVLKEVEDSPQKPEATAIPEESSKESKDDDSSVQANGTTNSDGSEPIAHPGDQTDGTLQTDPPNDVTMTVSDHTGSSVTTQAEVMPVPHNHTIMSTAHFHDGVKTSSPVVDPRHIRVMLPVEEKDRHIPVVQKTKQIPIIHEKPSDPGTPVANSVGTPSGLTHSTPGLKIHPSVEHGGTGPSTPVGAYEEVPAFEPDLKKVPIRSALKGAKQQEMLQRRLHEQLAQKLSASRTSSGDSPRGAPPKTAPKPRSVRMGGGVNFVDSSNKENQPVETYDNVPDYDNLHSDDSDEEIHWADEGTGSGRLAHKVHRQDSLARFLNNRPHRRELIERNIIPVRSEREKQQIREAIGSRLTRRLSLRPTLEELEDRNIILRQSQDDYERDLEERKRTLVRKLSFRPTVDELKDRKIIKFSDYIEVTDCHEYDRRADKPWTRLTPRDKAAIRKELNEFKSAEMDVHNDSRHLTRFHRP